MPFNNEVADYIYQYCQNHLPSDEWYKNDLNFIQDDTLRERIIDEFKAIRFVYKLYEGIQAKNENYMFEVRYQILAYASIYEAIIDYVLNFYFSDTKEYDELYHCIVPVRVDIPKNKLQLIQAALIHNDEEIIPYVMRNKKKEKSRVRFDDKCNAAKKLGIIHTIKLDNGKSIDLPQELIGIYGYRNGIHLMAEKKKHIQYELNLSMIAYKRMQPFIQQIKERLQLIQN